MFVYIYIYIEREGQQSTVREVPSMAMKPLGTMYWMRAGGVLILIWNWIIRPMLDTTQRIRTVDILCNDVRDQRRRRSGGRAYPL